ncbi:MAG: HAD hydrolase-like protein [Chloroflexi bacterium]|nr:HAD hydrolase-like protein [Chloroflexota bacterium]
MKAVFIQQATLLRDSHVDTSSEGDWQLMPATIEAVRMLSGEDTLVLVYGVAPERAERHEGDQQLSDTLLKVARQLESGGGRVDAVIGVQHRAPTGESDAPPYPGLVWSAAARFNLHPEQCYLLGDTIQDVQTATAAGVRPAIILGGRSIEDVFQRADLDKDFPLAPDLITAVQYIQVEEEIARQLGAPRGGPVPVPSEVLSPAQLDRLATLVVLSPQGRLLAERTGRSRIQRNDIARWLFFLTFGTLGLSLGIAYLLTHLYRVQPFPEFVYYLTLQFISRPLRGVLFILAGVAVLSVGVRSILRSSAVRDWLNGARRYIR